MVKTALQGESVVLRPVRASDLEVVVDIRSKPEVRKWWRGNDLAAEFLRDLRTKDFQLLVIEDTEGTVVGGVQWDAEDDPDYRHARIDIYLDPAVHGRGMGPDALRTLVRHLFEAEAHHRITIDPAADNVAAIRCYEKVGFRRVGLLRQYERSADGSYHDGVYMELIRDDFVAQK